MATNDFPAFFQTSQLSTVKEKKDTKPHENLGP